MQLTVTHSRNRSEIRETRSQHLTRPLPPLRQTSRTRAIHWIRRSQHWTAVGTASAAEERTVPTRRALVGGALLAFLPFLHSNEVLADVSPVTPLCDGDCISVLENKEMITTPSGLRFKDIVVGNGPKAPIGFQAVAHVVTLTQNGEIVDNTKERNVPYDIRVGAGQVVAGLDEALTSMKIGSIRRLYIPGSLGFKQNLKAAPGRPRIEANTPLIIDVQLLYVPGLDLEEEG